jgi:6,7-dimethyl-8-ribityllumazine synthase
MTAPGFAIAISRFNPEVADGLLAGAMAEFAERGAPLAQSDIFEAPGAFELPLIAQALARTGRYAGIACLGCVIKGDTAHFEFISGGVAWGLVSAGLTTQTPVAFGVLTTYDDAQALARCGDDAGNKGREAAAACVQAAATLTAIRASAE